MSKHRALWAAVVGLAALILVFPPGSEAFHFSEQAVKELTRCYLFLRIQQTALREVAEEYPDLAVRCRKAQTRLAIQFPGAMRRIEAKMAAGLGREKFAAAMGIIDRQMRSLADNLDLNHKRAERFIEVSEDLNRGRLLKPFQRYLFAVQYEKAPQAEIGDGFGTRHIFRVRQISPPVNLSLVVPLSWAGKSTGDNFVITKWGSENGNGWEMMVLGVEEVSGGEVDDAKLAEWVRSGEVKKYLPASFACLDYGLFELKKKRGLWFELRNTDHGPFGLNIYQHAYSVQLFYGKKSIHLYCACSGRAARRQEIDANFQRMLPMFRQVAHSMVFPQVKPRPLPPASATGSGAPVPPGK